MTGPVTRCATSQIPQRLAGVVLEVGISSHYGILSQRTFWRQFLIFERFKSYRVINGIVRHDARGIQMCVPLKPFPIHLLHHIATAELSGFFCWGF